MNLLRWIKSLLGVREEPFEIGPPRYRYVPGMEKPDPRYRAVPGPEARRREEQSRAALRGEPPAGETVMAGWARRRGA